MDEIIDNFKLTMAPGLHGKNATRTYEWAKNIPIFLIYPLNFEMDCTRGLSSQYSSHRLKAVVADRAAT